MRRPFRMRRAAPALAVAALASAAVAPGAPEWAAPSPAAAAPTAVQSFERGSPTWTSLRARLARVRTSTAPHGRAVVRVVRARGAAFGIAGGPPHAVRGVRGRHVATAWVRAVGPASARRPVRLVVVERTRAGRVVKTTASKPLRLTGRFRRVGVVWSPRSTANRVFARVVQVRARRNAAFEMDALMLSAARRPATPAPTQAPPAGGPAAGAPAAAPAAAEVRPYDPGALFNQPVTGLPLDPRSAAIARGLADNVRAVKVNASVSGEVPTVYVASPSDPFYAVTIDGRAERFRIPAGARAGSGSDHPMVILDPSHPDHGRNVELRLWQATIDHGARRVSGSGVGLFHYNNDGARLNPDGSPSVSVPFRGWGTGSGLSYMAGLLRPQDIASGRVTHAIRVAWGGNDFVDGFRAPAVKTDQGGSSGHGVQMGMRLRLDPAVDCSRRTAPVPPGRSESARETQFLRIVCRGLQEYGLIVLDGTSTDGLIVYMENEGTAAWEPVAGQKVYGSYGWILRDATTPGDGMSRTAESGIPWSRMQAVR